jgi:hypothetical protein
MLRRKVVTNCSRIVSMSVALTALTLAACGDEETTDRHLFKERGSVTQLSGALYGDHNTFWPGSPVFIRTCWENASSTATFSGTNPSFTITDATVRAWVQETVERSWMRYARIVFWDWRTGGLDGAPACNSNDNLRIKIVRSGVGGGSKGRLGTEMNHLQDGLELQFNEGTACMNAGPARYEHCIRSHATHEFGHLLGFYHEEERPLDGPGAQVPKQSDCGGAPGDALTPGTHYGRYDTESVMSYCGQPGANPATWHWQLSANDIASIQRIYGRHITGSLVTPRANCLAVASFNPGNPGTKPFLWDCDEVENDQEWARSFASRSLRITPDPGEEACLHFFTPNTEVRDCSGVNAQVWDFNNNEVRGWGGKCLNVPNGNTANGTPLELRLCSSDDFRLQFTFYDPNQRWNLTRVSSTSANFEIRLTADTSKCVTLANASGADGTPLTISTCNGASTQRFFRSGGSIRFAVGASSKCLDAVGVNDSQFRSGLGGPHNSAAIPLQLFTCGTSVMNQKWNTSGQIASTGGCLTHGTDANGANVDGTTCAASPSTAAGPRVWEYYF